MARQATWELEKAKLDRMQKALKAPWPASDIGKRLLALLDRAMPIEEQAHAKLDQLAKATDSGESLQKEIRELTNELGAIIEEAEAARAATTSPGSSRGFERAARRHGVRRRSESEPSRRIGTIRRASAMDSMDDSSPGLDLGRRATGARR